LKSFDKYQNDSEKKYTNLNGLVSDLYCHIKTKKQVLKGFRNLSETGVDKDDDIIHYKYIEVELDDSRYEELVGKIDEVCNWEKKTQQEILTETTDADGNIDFQKAAKLEKGYKVDFTDAKNGQTLYIHKIVNHYYIPILYSETEQIDYINHIIKTTSEKDFIKNLIDYIKDKTFDFE
jgi:hypothetical protein